MLHTQNKQLIHGKDKDGQTAITLACEFADVGTVELLIDLGADVNETGAYGRNPLMSAAIKGKKDTEKIAYFVDY